ncbi:MAG: glycosyltransferase [Firmicutes bacterium]|nr:glycosyltransferase [Bacillota bacterium]
MVNRPPVFYDPGYKRWRHFKGALELISAVLSIIFVVAIISILINPVLPSLGLKSAGTLPEVRHLLPPKRKPWFATHREHLFQRAKRGLIRTIASPPIPQPSRNVPPKSFQSELIGFFVNWDDTSFTSLKENIFRLDILAPEWIHLEGGDGSIILDDPARQNIVISYIRQNRPALKILPLVNNFNNQTMEWESGKLTKMLFDPGACRRTIDNLLQVIQSKGFSGICVDFESVPEKSQPALKVFMREIYARFHPLGYEVIQVVPIADQAFNYKALSQFCDYMIIMAFDEHWGTSLAGPVASQEWYEDGLKSRFSEIDPSKCIIAIGNYGYDWKGNEENGLPVSFQEAVRIARESEGEITFDSDVFNPTFDYYDEKDKLHYVWFLDAVTAFNQIVVGQRYKPHGYALWRLGAEDPSIWQVFDNRVKLDRSVAEGLKILHYGYDLDYEGKGEILKVTATPGYGERQITFNEKKNLITGEHLLSYPSPYIITRWGGYYKKKIALTFDDGPDNTYTPQILDVLKSYHAPATFFVVGLNADLNSSLLSRIVNEGHEIGNHTFTHPNIAIISPRQLRLEINATERLFESRLGIHPLMFRPPYAEDVEPETPAQVKPLVYTSALGYYTIGMQIDPGDWKKPGVDKIVQETIDEAERGIGNIVLLHDGGGDRSETVEALPKIIEGLRAKGFEIVPVSNLLGISRDKVMPPAAKSEWIFTDFDYATFVIIKYARLIFSYLFFIGILLGILRFLFIGALAVSEWWQERHTKYSGDYLPSVSIVVPAYNEEKVVVKTVNALLESSYPKFDIIAVDDGSNDGTYQSLVNAFAGNPRVRSYTKPNGGKADALNYGIEKTGAEIIIALDADTIFLPDTISKLVRHFENPGVGAVAGNAKVGNRINLLTNLQAVEYITSQNLDRRAFDALNCITVIPGAVGAWRRELILKAGGFSGDTLAEDADLTLTILKTGKKINYEDEAIAMTEAPDTIKGFLRQRFRWMFGSLQAVWKHLDTLLRPRYGALGMFAIPNVFIFQIFFPLISPVIDLVMAGSLLEMLWQKSQHPLGYNADSLKIILFYYALFLALDFFGSVIAFILERKEDWKLLVWLFFQRFFYRQLMYYIAVKSVLAAIRGKIVGWGKVERKATVQ